MEAVPDGERIAPALSSAHPIPPDSVALCEGPVLTMDVQKDSHASTRDASLTLLMRCGDATAAELSESLGVSVQVMRRHLRGLEEEGLVEASPASEGPGRPSNHWRLTEAGRNRFPDGSEHFAQGLLSSMITSLPAEIVDGLMHQQAIEKAELYRREIGEGSLHFRLQRLVELRRREGYVAECLPNGEDQSWVLSEYHCSVMRLAEEFPILCEQELQLIRHTFQDCQVERVHWRLEEGHSCGFKLVPTPALAQKV